MGFLAKAKFPVEQTQTLLRVNHCSTEDCSWSVKKCKLKQDGGSNSALTGRVRLAPTQTGLETNTRPPERQDLQEEMNSQGATGWITGLVTSSYQQANSFPFLQIRKALAPADLTSLIKNGHEYFNKRCNPSCSGRNKGTQSGKEALPLSYVPYCMCFTAGKHVLISYLSADCTVLLHSCC